MTDPDKELLGWLPDQGDDIPHETTAPRRGDLSRRARGLTSRVYITPETLSLINQLAELMDADPHEAITRAVRAAILTQGHRRT